MACSILRLRGGSGVVVEVVVAVPVAVVVGAAGKYCRPAARELTSAAFNNVAHAVGLVLCDGAAMAVDGCIVPGMRLIGGVTVVGLVAAVVGESMAGYLARTAVCCWCV